ncbi:MAG TPA: DUF4112 domain-containing protein [Candidatus Limnocylindria bacterium]|nr:DUF4112 domain-containing protein [Candidatus Limnocylindria bacterium]
MTQVLPRRTDASAASAAAEVELLAWLLDNSIPIPGTGRRIGVDSLVGLIPGLGDVISGGLGLLVVLRGAQRGLPTIVVARMLVNVALDFAIGAIPFIGDLFDMWFKSNQRNVDLMRRYVTTPTASTAGQWVFFGAILAAVGLAAFSFVWLVWNLLGAILR